LSNFKDDNETDVLYQWRLQRRIEQARNNERITFPSKVKLRLSFIRMSHRFDLPNIHQAYTFETDRRLLSVPVVPLTTDSMPFKVLPVRVSVVDEDVPVPATTSIPLEHRNDSPLKQQLRDVATQTLTVSSPSIFVNGHEHRQ
jgi:hypothetical protein